uniref:Predicted protein n=1 Tax=Hordeum vulgare subsp. vulgare TaxID=112509 RepID=F2DTL7_HORVV|nr:predicted protein [Hordeum vulgare subsp. vulgare]
MAQGDAEGSRSGGRRRRSRTWLWLRRPRRAALAAGRRGAHLQVAVCLWWWWWRRGRCAAAAEQPPEGRYSGRLDHGRDAGDRAVGGLRRLRRHRLPRRAAGCHGVLGAEEEHVGGEDGRLRIGLRGLHGGRLVGDRAPAERAGGVRPEPHVDALDVERVAAPRQQARGLPGGELRDADGAVGRGVPLGDHPPRQGHDGRLVQAGPVAGAPEDEPRAPAPAVRPAAADCGRGAPVALGAEEEVEADDEGDKDGGRRGQHGRRRRHGCPRHRHRSALAPQIAPSSPPKRLSLPLPNRGFSARNCGGLLEICVCEREVDLGRTGERCCTWWYIYY